MSNGYHEDGQPALQVQCSCSDCGLQGEPAYTESDQADSSFYAESDTTSEDENTQDEPTPRNIIVTTDMLRKVMDNQVCFDCNKDVCI